MSGRAWFFAFFFASGFASLVYEVVWLRMAMAQFGVTSALTSIVLSVFMAGLALGSWAAGHLARRLRWEEDGRSALRAYGALELLIGLSAFVVPAVLQGGHTLLAAQAESVSWRSPAYHLASGMWVVVAMLPFCALMGATFPAAMAAMRAQPGAERSFSYLYLANVLGALAGTVASAFLLIELLGLRGTARATAVLNVAVGASALFLASRAARRGASILPGPSVALAGGRGALWFLFATGLMSLAMEVVWIRQFTPYLGTVVYAFAAVLALYLAGTFLGSRIYRSWIERRAGEAPGGTLGVAWACVGVTALLPLIASDPRLPLPAGFSLGVLRVAAGILPFCATVGFLTPMLVDRWSRGDPRRAGSAYAINVLGCIAGPLLAGFVLLPNVSEAWALLVLGVPLAVSGALAGGDGLRPALSRGLALGVLAVSVTAIAWTRSFESRFPQRIVRRDETATVVATGTGWNRLLLVNGFSMTILTPTSKVMAHLPLAFHPEPKDGLVLCFGMGTTFRSMHSWGIPTTVVELVPSVPALAGFYHPDGDALLHAPRTRVVVDDARRFMERTAEQYDVITLDPPPPVEAAASSLLYSREFYELVQRRLRPGGILQQWLPGGELELAVSFARTISSVFPHVRMFGGVEGWGIHFLASDRPIPALPAELLAARLPPAAAADLAEWGPEPTARAQLAKVLSQELPVAATVGALPEVPILTDDRPYNEYFLIRRALLRPQPGGLRFPTGLAGMPEPAP